MPAQLSICVPHTHVLCVPSLPFSQVDNLYQFSICNFPLILVDLPFYLATLQSKPKISQAYGKRVKEKQKEAKVKSLGDFN